MENRLIQKMELKRKIIVTFDVTEWEGDAVKAEGSHTNSVWLVDRLEDDVKIGTKVEVG